VRSIPRSCRRPFAVLASGVALACCVTVLASTAGGASVAPRITTVFHQGEDAALPVTNILPFNNCVQFTDTNFNLFQPQLFRPLYWYGKGASTTLQPALSIGDLPAYSLPSGGGYQRVTITLRHWRYANGESVTARSVKFFLNLWNAENAVPGSQLCGDIVPGGVPTDIADVTTPHGINGNQVAIDFTGPVNRIWMTADFLSSIVPMPKLWDKVATAAASGSAGCGLGPWGSAGTTAKCQAVYAYLTAQAAHLSSYATNALWKVSDGPYRLKAFHTNGYAVLVPNPTYSGSPHSHVAAVILVPYATGAAEQADLAAHKLQAGFVATSALGPSPSAGVPGPNLVAGIAGTYTAKWDSSWEYDFSPYNFTATDPMLAAVDQTFIRQAMQEAINQSSVISSVYDGYATPTCSPLPYVAGPPNPCPNTFSTSGAVTLLRQHGFEYNTDLHVEQCFLAAGCGTGLPQGYELKFKLAFNGGDAAITAEVASEVSDWSAAGIVVTPVAVSFPALFPDCASSPYSICVGVGYAYSPAYDPTGENIYLPTGYANFGGYGDATMSTLIAATTSGGATNLSPYAAYADAQDPNVWQPSPVTASEIRTSCVGALAPNPLGDFMPEFIAHC
jgi:peptide/nickel transport system substrate-binding protein